MNLSLRARITPASPIRRLSPLAATAKLGGSKIYQLNIGQPDIESPPEFLKGVQQYSSRVVAYESSEGNSKLRTAWSEYINKSLGLQTAPEKFLITMGASEALIFIFMTLCDPGDEIIIFDPTYANYMGFASVTGVKLIPLHTNLDDGFRLPDLNLISASVSSKTRAILLCNPNNPTGTVYDRKQLEAVLGLCEEHDLFLIMDETYREILFGGREPLSALQLAPSSTRIVIIDSLSKRFSLCGSRIGCLYTNHEEFYQKCLNIAQARLAAPTIDQFAAAVMLENLDPNYFENARKEYEGRCTVLCDVLENIPGIQVHRPAGAFYTVARLDIANAEDFAIFMLTRFRDKNETVFIAPAAGFYMGLRRGANKARVAFVLNKEDLRRSGEILEAGLAAYKKENR